VRDTARQAPDGIHLLRLQQLCLDVLATADVPNDPGEPPMRTRAVLADRDLDREFMAIGMERAQLHALPRDRSPAGLQIAAE